MKFILDPIDNFLNYITMYRLVLYYLIFLVAAAIGLAFAGILPYNPAAILFTALGLIVVCWCVNTAFAYFFEVPANAESAYITALILTLLISPTSSLPVWLVFWSGVWAMASKYLLAIRRKHIFNPAAFGVAVTALVMGQAASWWVGTASMFPFVLLGGVLIVRKISRWDLVLSFLAFAFISVLGATAFNGGDVATIALRTVTDTPLFFFAFVMLTEPLTAPPERKFRIGYGALVGFLFAPWVHAGSLYSTPELSLLAGNIFSYFASPKGRYLLKLKQKIQTAPDIYEFVFVPDRKFPFRPGQYLEWTLGHSPSDARGNRRYFTIASSPTENDIRLGVKFYRGASSFKKALLGITDGGVIHAGQLAGEFTLPRDKSEKLIFIAGGIGITPFRSMVKYLLDNGEKRDVTLFYSANTAADFVYKDIFAEAENRLGMKIVYALTDQTGVPESWAGERGTVSAEMIMREAPDWRERSFYLSGPRSMVVSFERTLERMGVSRFRIKTDFFPGFA